MEVTQADNNITWPLWRRVGFRFLSVFLLLIVSPWGWLRLIPGGSWLLEPFNKLLDRFVGWVNAAFLHVRPVLVPTNGSGDTSYAWAELATFFWLALIACLVWSVVDWRRKRGYAALNYWLCLMVRYNLILYSLSYGYVKIFLLQMPAPDISAMATPLGDFLPMRLSWMFIGYSGPYQFFCGCMEVMVGLLLLYRRTATLGALLSVGVFANVAMLNLSYDIPVKLFSLELLGMSVFLLAQDWRRLAAFFLLNRPGAESHIYNAALTRRWMRRGRVAAKVPFILLAMVLPLREVWSTQAEQRLAASAGPFQHGLYDVAIFAINRDTIPATAPGSLRWMDMVLDAGGKGSIKTADTSLPQHYGRAYFRFEADTVLHRLMLKAGPRDAETLMRFRYGLRDTGSIELWGSRGQDSLYVLLQRNPHRFQLAERQFHWLSEANR